MTLVRLYRLKAKVSSIVLFATMERIVSSQKAIPYQIGIEKPAAGCPMISFKDVAPFPIRNMEASIRYVLHRLLQLHSDQVQ